ncbi:hypothetical protein E2542_SST18650 [Spatholobus suberectus]|nr:hypothetical protein E2542_SST18650 [Spatholobus suberectus]
MRAREPGVRNKICSWDLNPGHHHMRAPVGSWKWVPYICASGYFHYVATSKLIEPRFSVLLEVDIVGKEASTMFSLTFT